MKKELRGFVERVVELMRRPKVRRMVALGAAAIAVLRSYFVQEALAAEAFFAAAFAIVAVTVGGIYLAGATVAAWFEGPGQKMRREQALVTKGE
jgi:hypothetical protein